mmetsp:Transcript_52944/g.151619  ORF Transcript_52944/g.151619 Transcript_52944/m.151619 type:complete len:270 (-) Transcript_52944:210-1019(-)
MALKVSACKPAASRRLHNAVPGCSAPSSAAAPGNRPSAAAETKASQETCNRMKNADRASTGCWPPPTARAALRESGTPTPAWPRSRSRTSAIAPSSATAASFGSGPPLQSEAAKPKGPRAVARASAASRREPEPKPGPKCAEPARAESPKTIPWGTPPCGELASSNSAMDPGRSTTSELKSAKEPTASSGSPYNFKPSRSLTSSGLSPKRWAASSKGSRGNGPDGGGRRNAAEASGASASKAWSASSLDRRMCSVHLRLSALHADHCSR